MRRLHGAAGLAVLLLAGCGGDPAPMGAGDSGTATGDLGSTTDTGSVAPTDVQSDPCADPRTWIRTDGGPLERPANCPLPNLIPVVRNTQIQTRTFSPGSCEVMEGCTRAGRRRLLRFDLVTPNIGRGDLYLGPPARGSRPDGRFEFGACHGHYHFLGYADYRLLNSMNREIGMGHKQSFCLLDSGRHTMNGMMLGQQIPFSEYYTCNDQGIHAGWYDLYDRALDCQYIDITDVPAGEYRVRVRINERRGLTETNYDDNETVVPVTIPAMDPVSTDPTDACPGEVTGVTRDCGWVVDRGMSCTPLRPVTVGCNAMCSPGIGACVGNPAIRVCPGDGPCTHAQMLAESDDSCGNQCPSATFMCPVRGRFTVLTGGSRSGNAYECRIEGRGTTIP